jgi:hypothetical protein
MQLCDSWACVYEWAHDWQTLLAGLLAFVGAVVTVWVLEAQISESRRQGQRKTSATRALVSAALENVGDYCLACTRWLQDIREPARQVETQSDLGDLPVDPVPRLDKDSLVILRDCIEHADKGTSVAVAELLGKFQLVSARLKLIHDCLANRSKQRYNFVNLQGMIDAYVVDALELCARSEGLYSYARQGLNLEAPDIKAMELVFYNLGLNELHHANVYSLMRKRCGVGLAKQDPAGSAPPVT